MFFVEPCQSYPVSAMYSIRAHFTQMRSSNIYWFKWSKIVFQRVEKVVWFITTHDRDIFFCVSPFIKSNRVKHTTTFLMQLEDNALHIFTCRLFIFQFFFWDRYKSLGTDTDIMYQSTGISSFLFWVWISNHCINRGLWFVFFFT